MNPRRLYRSRSDRQLAGVAGGIASYLDVDPTVVRVLWIFSVFFGGFGILVYLVMAFVVPLEPIGAPSPAWISGQGDQASAAADAAPAGERSPIEHRPGRGGLVLGVALVVFGGIALANILLPGWIAGGGIVAAFFVAIGIALLVGALRRPETTA